MIVDARGCSCPQPILMTQKALKANNSIQVLVDNPTAKENVLRFAQSRECTAKLSNEDEDGTFTIHIEKTK